MGHGFYQFSPDLFFRLFSQENGFRLERMLAFEYETRGARYEVADPSQLGRRVELSGTKSRILLWVVARKLGANSLRYVSYPKQSDYVLQWERNNRQLDKNGASETHVGRRLKTYLNEAFPWFIDHVAGIRDRWRLRKANRKGLRADDQAFRRIP